MRPLLSHYMTKYILNSGNFREDRNLAQIFFEEITKGLGGTPHNLICCFALPREDWEAKFTKDTTEFPGFFPANISYTFELAFPDRFPEQIKRSDVIFLHGGDDHLVQYWLKKFDLPELLDDKVVVTSSASSHALSQSFWTCDWRMCMNGLGILPIKFLAHYKSSYGHNDPRGPINWEQAQEELKTYGDDQLPIHALEEGHFVVIEK